MAGQITARVGESYLLQLFEWFLGTETNQTLVPPTEMSHWLFYDSAEEMTEYYRKYCYRMDAREKQEKAAEAAETVQRRAEQ
jgi:hypothetical protein